MSGTIPSLTVQGAQARICLERPEQANRLDNADLDCLMTHLIRIDEDPAIRVVRIATKGKHFCAGYNFSDLEQGSDGTLFERVIDRLENLRPVTIAEVQGGAFGGASDLALACDFRIGGAHASLTMPAARFGLHLYGGLLQRYVSRLGLNAAKRLILTAERLDAEALLNVGFLTHLVREPESVSESAEQLAQQIATLAPLAVAGMKQQLNAIARGTFDPQALAENVRLCSESEDFQEGLRALEEKRAPVFKGR